MFSLIRLITLTCFILVFLPPLVVSANGGPVYYPSEGHGLLRFADGSNIRLVRERIHFSLKKESNQRQDSAKVLVEYELNNHDSSSMTVDVVFITPSQGEVSITEKNDKLNSVSSIEYLPANWYLNKMNYVVEPISGKKLSLSRNGTVYEDPNGTKFSLSFQPGETKSIVIEYMEKGGMYGKGVINTIYSHMYYFSPAAFWEGEPQLDLEVALPEPGYKLYSNLPMENIHTNTYSAHFERLPSEEWYFSYTKPLRLLFPTNVEWEHNLLILGSAIVLTLLAAATAIRLRNIIIFVLAAMGILIFTAFYVTKIGGYPFNDIFVGMADLAVLLFISGCFIFIRKKVASLRGEKSAG